MNERIRLLAEQAKTESSQWLGSKPATTITYDELEKLAELIVRECASVCENSNYEFGTIFTKMIKEHFGVEE